ncbi:thioredoxin domain-containing protein [bacterium]|nr:thioredoxin domain-containing protein [bacterium]
MTQSPKKTSRPVGAATPVVKRKSIPPGVWIVGGGAVVVVLLVVVLVFANRPAPVSAEVYEGFPPEWVTRRSLGNPDAPVVIQGWEDFRCPACAQWNQTIKPQLMENYLSPDGAVAGGSVRFEYHYFPLTSHGETAFLAAQAAECAADQGGFWVYHDRLFNATNEGPAGFTLDRLRSYGNEVGLDGDALSQCVISQKYANEVQASVGQAISMGLNSTPSILVNGQLFDNGFDYQGLTAEIRRLIEAAD